ncbi:MAG: tRNA preQ1(34) S-adenosylmethionine ribosyltransferase-isomerase QueA [Pseudomonadota bacterium]
MTLDDFDYPLDDERIALYPADPPDTSRLLVLKGQSAPQDDTFLNLPQHLKRGDILVFNDTKVIPARLFGTRGEARVEVTLHQRRPGVPGEWFTFVKNAKRLKENDLVEFGDDFRAKVAQKMPDGQVVLDFRASGEKLAAKLAEYGQMPLPPYIASRRPVTEQDASDYQTMFAKKPGAVAAPTASLHFTPKAMAGLQEAGIGQEIVTLHVGAGTFLPVKVDNIDEHKMHSEYGEISGNTALRLMAAKHAGRRIIAVGTTALRVLEAATDEHGILAPFAQETALFIRPGYTFRFVDGLITNFHLPKSTLIMLVSALMGRERILSAYAHANAQKYRFFSYGDACLMLP